MRATVAGGRRLFFEILDILGRGARLRCPCCGHGRLFRTRFRTYDRCLACGEPFEREPGQAFGVVYINLGLSGVLPACGCVVMNVFTAWPVSQQIGLLLPLAALGPFVFFRLATGLWTSLVFLGEGLYIQWPNR